MKVLVVDDEVLIRRSIGRILESKGHEVCLAADGIEGLKMWKRFEPDLVFLDVLMPGLSGPEVLREIAPHGAKVILMSAYSGKEDIENFQKLGIETFLQKPFDDIFTVIENMEKLIVKN